MVKPSRLIALLPSPIHLVEVWDVLLPNGRLFSHNGFECIDKQLGFDWCISVRIHGVEGAEIINIQVRHDRH